MSHSPFSHFQVQDLARVAFGNHLQRPATDLAIDREALPWSARVNDQIEALAAIRALDGFADFHNQSSQDQD